MAEKLIGRHFAKERALAVKHFQEQGWNIIVNTEDSFLMHKNECSVQISRLGLNIINTNRDKKRDFYMDLDSLKEFGEAIYKYDDLDFPYLDPELRTIKNENGKFKINNLTIEVHDYVTEFMLTLENLDKSKIDIPSKDFIELYKIANALHIKIKTAN